MQLVCHWINSVDQIIEKKINAIIKGSALSLGTLPDCHPSCQKQQNIVGVCHTSINVDL
jgi:hypothetical protein